MLDGSVSLLRDIVEGESKGDRNQGTSIRGKVTEDPVGVLRSRLLTAASKAESGTQEGEKKKKSDGESQEWVTKMERIWALGPRRVGPNVLLTPGIPSAGRTGMKNRDNVGGIAQAEATRTSAVLVRGSPQISQKLGLISSISETPNVSEKNSEDETDIGTVASPLLTEALGLEFSVVSGFQLATASGPLCEEPMWGLAFTVEAFVSSAKVGDGAANSLDASSGADQYGPFSSQVLGLYSVIP